MSLVTVPSIVLAWLYSVEYDPRPGYAATSRAGVKIPKVDSNMNDPCGGGHMAALIGRHIVSTFFCNVFL